MSVANYFPVNFVLSTIFLADFYVSTQYKFTDPRKDRSGDTFHLDHVLSPPIPTPQAAPAL